MDPRNRTEFRDRIRELLRRNLAAEALALCEERLDADPHDAWAAASAGALYLAGGETRGAADALRRAIRLQPDMGAAWANLGICRLVQEDCRGAYRFLAKAAGLGHPKPLELAAACRGLARRRYEKGSWSAAAALLRRALEATPDDAQTWGNVGALYASVGKVRSGLRAMRRAVLLNPADLSLRSNLAVVSNYQYRWTPEQVRDWHLELFRDLERAPTPHANEPDPERRLRVGYYCADFRFGPPAFFLPPLLEHHDRTRFVIFAYSNTQYGDEHTLRMRNLSDHWRDVRQLNDAELAESIRADGIDVLVDRTGHFECGRPGLFARRPAPVQFELPGYPTTTGTPGICYRIVDSYTDPPGSTGHLHIEKLVRLPDCFACYSPAADSPPITSLPALANGHVTFGCFQKREKINAADLRVWTRILQATPGSRLVFHHSFSGVREAPLEFRRGIDRYFRQRGIGASRVLWEGGRPHYEHMEAIGRVDIALDTFPYNGMTTTCECLWMGVPVVSRRGSSHISRVGYSYLSNAGLPDWSADSEEAYIAIAVEKARDLDALSRTRAALRAQMSRMPLTDGQAHAGALEAAYRSAWRDWCVAQREVRS